MPVLWNFQKSWLWTLLCQQKIHHFFFSHTWDTDLKYLPKGCPYIFMYSALHLMQWFSQILDVSTLKIRQKFFDFTFLWIRKNVASTRLEVIARTKYTADFGHSGPRLAIASCGHSGNCTLRHWIRSHDRAQYGSCQSEASLAIASLDQNGTTHWHLPLWPQLAIVIGAQSGCHMVIYGYYYFLIFIQKWED